MVFWNSSFVFILLWFPKPLSTPGTDQWDSWIICDLCTIPRPCSNFNWQRQYLYPSWASYGQIATNHMNTLQGQRSLFIKQKGIVLMSAICGRIYTAVYHLGYIYCIAIYGVFLFVAMYNTPKWFKSVVQMWHCTTILSECESHTEVTA